MDAVTLRPAVAADGSFLQQMLVAAADWRHEHPRRTVAQVMADPSVAHYVSGWPRTGDTGVIAEADSPVAAAWWRFFTADDPGYGFVDAAIPEVTIGVRHGWRRQGVGEQMLQALIDQACAQDLPALSLSVESDNRAVALYERVGFAVVATGGGAMTMLLRMNPA